LYSHKSHAWKITDFGLTSIVEGRSSVALQTRYARGTPCYRAPELIENQEFTYKVDIWAVGCILYELTFRKKAFEGDWAVLRYSQENRFEGKLLPLPDDSEIFKDNARKSFVYKMICEMLQTQTGARPCAEGVRERFINWEQNPAGLETRQRIREETRLALSEAGNKSTNPNPSPWDDWFNSSQVVLKRKS